MSRERDESPYRRHEHSSSRSRSRGRDDRARSRSPRGRSHGRSYREDSHEDNRYDRGDRRRDREDRRPHDHYSVVCSLSVVSCSTFFLVTLICISTSSLQAPSATVVVKGLSQKTTEEDLYQILVTLLIYLSFEVFEAITASWCIGLHYLCDSFICIRRNGDPFVMFELLKSEILASLVDFLLLISLLWYDSRGLIMLLYIYHYTP